MDGEKYEKESRMGSLLAEKTVYHCRVENLIGL